MASVGSSARKELDKKKKKSEIRRSSGRATGPMMDHSDGQKKKKQNEKEGKSWTYGRSKYQKKRIRSQRADLGYRSEKERNGLCCSDNETRGRRRNDDGLARFYYEATCIARHNSQQQLHPIIIAIGRSFFDDVLACRPANETLTSSARYHIDAEGCALLPH